MKLSLNRPYIFLISLVSLFVLPPAITTLGTSLTFTFAVLLTLFVWLSAKWRNLLDLTAKSKSWEITLGISILAINIARNFANLGESSFGLVDMLIGFIALSIAFYGIHAVKFFLLPAIYIFILIVGYQLEFSLTQVKSLEVTLANLMATMMQGLGVSTIVFGNTVGLYGASTIFLQVAGPCTGVKGILAFGSLSTMTVIDIKTKIKRIILIISIGFLGTFLINLARLALIFLAAHYIGIEIALAIHTYLGYGLFIAWVLIFWSITFKYLTPKNKVLPPATSK